MARRPDGGSKVLVLGLDGAAPELVGRWVREGQLPHLASLAGRGALGTLLSTPNAMSPAAWSSFATGLEPGNHGVFYFQDRVPGTYETRYVNALSRDGMPLWTALSRAGKRVASLFVPLTWPAVPVNGVLASGWLAPSVKDPAYSYPRDLPQRMLAAAPEFELHTGMTEFVRRGRYGEALARKETALRAKGKVAADLLGGEPWDVFIVVLDETDPVQHYFWHFLDPTHPEHSPEGTRAFGEAVLGIYRAADEVVGRLLALTGEETFVFVISDHGSGQNGRGHLFLKGLLRAHGLERATRSHWGSRLARTAHDAASRVLPSRLRHLLAGRLPSVHRKLADTSFVGGIDWAASQAYTFWSSGCSEPWIGVRGRDPQGTVAPGAEYEAVAARVTEAILTATDTRTGERAAGSVARKEDLYWGPHLDRAPDLLVHWRPDLVVQGLRTAEGGEAVETPVAEDLRTGNHRREGLLLAAGPKGQFGRFPTSAGIADLAPTILGLLDLPPPHPLDGRPWTELFPQAVRVHPPEGDAIAGGGADSSMRETAVIEKRLEDLGYL